jgi:DNA-binding transcriptional regulator LsrR (DeoR family)
VQLVGVLGSTKHTYSGQVLVENLTRKIGGKGMYLYMPFLVENENIANILMKDKSVKEVISLGKKCDVAILGIGSTKSKFCSLYQGGHINLTDLSKLQEAQAVGDVCGHYFNISGELIDVEFQNRLIKVKKDDLLNIPIRLAVAGNIAKVEAILGAIRGGFINNIVTDNFTATRILEISHIQNDDESR